MAKIVVLYQNYADSAALTGGSFISAFPLTNGQDDDIGVVARTTNPLTASTQFVANLGAARTVGGIAIGPTNCAPGSTYRIRAYSDSALTSLVYDSGTKTVTGTTIDWSSTSNYLAWEDPGFWEGIPDILDRDDVPVWLVDIPSASQFAQFWKIEITDTANPDGYVQFGRIFIARSFRPSINYDFDNNFIPHSPIFDMTETLGGRRSFWRRGKRRMARFAFKTLAESELFGDVFRLANVLGADKQCFIVPDPSDTTNFLKRSFLATLKTAPPIVQAKSRIGTTVLDAEEVV